MNPLLRAIEKNAGYASYTPASEGCIVCGPSIRNAINTEGGGTLTVQ